jgi:hypothetical protein
VTDATLESHLHAQLDHAQRFFWHRLRWRAVRGLLPADEPFTLVDVGAGTGVLGEFLRRDRPFARYSFVEPLESLAGRLAAAYGADADVSADDAYHGARFVTLLDVLEHIEDDFAFVRELAAKLDPGATLIVTVPALARLWSPWDVGLGHHRRYDRAALRAPLEAAGLDVLELSYLFPEMLPAALLRARRQATGVEFPRPPAALNALLYGVGSATLALRRLWPAGTSLLAVTRAGR